MHAPIDQRADRFELVWYLLIFIDPSAVLELISQIGTWIPGTNIQYERNCREYIFDLAGSLF